MRRSVSLLTLLLPLPRCPRPLTRTALLATRTPSSALALTAAAPARPRRLHSERLSAGCSRRPRAGSPPRPPSAARGQRPSACPRACRSSMPSRRLRAHVRRCQPGGWPVCTAFGRCANCVGAAERTRDGVALRVARLLRWRHEGRLHDRGGSRGLCRATDGGARGEAALHIAHRPGERGEHCQIPNCGILNLRCAKGVIISDHKKSSQWGLNAEAIRLRGDPRSCSPSGCLCRAAPCWRSSAPGSGRRPGRSRERFCTPARCTRGSAQR